MDPLEPQVLAALEERHGTGATAMLEREPLTLALPWGDEPAERLLLPQTLEGPARYLLRRVAPRAGWLAEASADERLREVQLLASGLLRALPPGLGATTVAAVPLGDERVALLQRDVPAPDAPLSPDDARRVLTGLAALHSAFFGFPARHTAGLGLCPVGVWLALFAPRPVAPEPVRAGWARLRDDAPAMWPQLAPLLDDPVPLVGVLRALPDTLLNGDVRLGSLSLAPGQLLFQRWAQVLRAPGALDLGWLLAVDGHRLGVTLDEAVESYRSARQERGRLPAAGERWERELALGLLAGALRGGWLLDRSCLSWWQARVDQAVALLSLGKVPPP